jgi:hypothetical protein
MGRAAKSADGGGVCHELDAADVKRVTAFMAALTRAYELADPDLVDALGHKGEDARSRQGTKDLAWLLMDDGNKVRTWSARPYTEPTWEIMRTQQHYPPPSIWIDVTLNDGKKDDLQCYFVSPDEKGVLRACYCIDRVKPKKSKQQSQAKKLALAKFATALKTAITSQYKKLAAKYPDLYGYALYTTDDLAGLHGVANRESSLTVSLKDKMYNFNRYFAVEWKESGFGKFDSVNKLLNKLFESHCDERSELREDILNLCLDVLSQLERDGLFGPRTTKRFVGICIGDSSDEVMLKSVKRLNSRSVAKAFESQW